MSYLAVCAIVKDEEPYIEEWLRFHSLVGVERFFIYDDGSRLPLRKFLARYVEAGLVVVLDPPKPNDQLRAYDDCLARLGGEATWLAFIDVDEYLVPKACDDLREILFLYEDYAGLCVSQSVFGSAGHVSRPRGLQLEAYDQGFGPDYPENKLVKSVVRPDRTERALSAHNFACKPGFFCVNEDLFPVGSPFSYHTSRTVQLNHYYYRSQQDFSRKIERGAVFARDRVRGFAKYAMQAFYAQASAPTEPDRAAAPYLACLRELTRLNDPETLLTIPRMRKMENIDAYAARSRELVRAGELVEAGKVLFQAAYDFGENPVVLYLLGDVFLRLGRADDAALALARSIRRFPTPEAYYFLVHARMEQGRTAEAVRIAKYLAMRIKTDWNHFHPWDNRLDALVGLPG